MLYDYHFDEWLGGQGSCRHGRCSFAVLTQNETITCFNCSLYNEYLLWEVEEDFILCG